MSNESPDLIPTYIWNPSEYDFDQPTARLSADKLSRYNKSIEDFKVKCKLIRKSLLWYYVAWVVCAISALVAAFFLNSNQGTMKAGTLLIQVMPFLFFVVLLSLGRLSPSVGYINSLLNKNEVHIDPTTGVEYVLHGLFYENCDGELEGIIEIQDKIERPASEGSEKKKVLVKKPDSELRPVSQGKKVKIRGLDLDKGKDQGKNKPKEKEAEIEKEGGKRKQVQLIPVKPQKNASKEFTRKTVEEPSLGNRMLNNDFDGFDDKSNQLSIEDEREDNKEAKKISISPSRRQDSKIVLNKPERKDKSKTIMNGFPNNQRSLSPEKKQEKPKKPSLEPDKSPESKKPEPANKIQSTPVKYVLGASLNEVNFGTKRQSSARREARIGKPRYRGPD